MVIDIIFVVVFIYGFYVGYSRGIISTVFTILSFLFGFIAAVRFTDAMTDFLTTAFNDNSPLWYIAGFLATFLIAMLAIRMFARGLEGILQTVQINFINQIAGGALFGGLMIYLYSVVLGFYNATNPLSPAIKKESISYQYIQHFPGQAKQVGEWAYPHLQEFWHKSMDAFDRLEEMSEVEENSSIFDIEEESTEEKQ